jgi:hypothetical protein
MSMPLKVGKVNCMSRERTARFLSRKTVHLSEFRYRESWLRFYDYLHESPVECGNNLTTENTEDTKAPKKKDCSLEKSVQ